MHEILPEFFISLRPNSENSIWVKIIKLIERLSANFANAVITIHDPAKQILTQRNKGIAGKIHVIMNGVDEAEFRKSELVKSNEFTIMFNGTVVKLLNLDLILRCLHKLKNRIPREDYARIKFRIFGDGPAVNGLHELAKELGIEAKFVHHGFVKPEIMHKEVLKSSVCVLPPLKNIYSDLFYTTKLVEMVYLKIPVIATRLRTYEYYYGDDSLFYFDSGNEEQLIERIKEVLYSRDLVFRKVNNAWAAYQKVSWNAVMKKRYLDLIHNLGLK
jgi:glycosyltransferase involved in cell wall biosynthesis